MLAAQLHALDATLLLIVFYVKGLTLLYKEFAQNVDLIALFVLQSLPVQFVNLVIS